MKKLIISFILLLTALYFFVYQVSGFSFPEPRGYVNDFANIISPEAEKRLEDKLTEVKKQNTHEIAVVTVSSLEGQTVEDYTIGLAEKWKVGNAEADNGVIFLNAPNERKIRIEVGSGVEDKLTDIDSKRIIDNVTPYFKDKNYDQAFETGVTQILEQLEASPSATTEATNETSTPSGGMWIIIIFAGFIIIMFIVAESPYTPIGGQGTWGISAPYSYWKSDDSSDSSGGSFFSSGGGGFSGYSGGGFSGGGSSGSY